MSAKVVYSKATHKLVVDASGFDSAVKKLAPSLDALREQKALRAVRKLVIKVNELGILAPSGKRFTFGSMYRVLTRMRELDVGKGPRSRSLAAQDRETAYFSRRPSARRRALVRPEIRSSTHLTTLGADSNCPS